MAWWCRETVAATLYWSYTMQSLLINIYVLPCPCKAPQVRLHSMQSIGPGIGPVRSSPIKKKSVTIPSIYKYLFWDTKQLIDLCMINIYNENETYNFRFTFFNQIFCRATVSVCHMVGLNVFIYLYQWVLWFIMPQYPQGPVQKLCNA